MQARHQIEPQSGNCNTGALGGSLQAISHPLQVGADVAVLVKTETGVGLDGLRVFDIAGLVFRAPRQAQATPALSAALLPRSAADVQPSNSLKAM
jgi:hypothetical protein